MRQEVFNSNMSIEQGVGRLKSRGPIISHPPSSFIHRESLLTELKYSGKQLKNHCTGGGGNYIFHSAVIVGYSNKEANAQQSCDNGRRTNMTYVG